MIKNLIDIKIIKVMIRIGIPILPVVIAVVLYPTLL